MTQSVFKERTFNTEMGSLAFGNIYDLLHVIEANRYDCDTHVKDMPSAVRKTFPVFEKSMNETVKASEDTIVGWLNSIVERENGDYHDVHYLDELLDGRLEQEGYIGRITFPVENTFSHTESHI